MYDICKQVVMILVLALLFLLVLKTKQYGGRMIKGGMLNLFIRSLNGEMVSVDLATDATVADLYKSAKQNDILGPLSFSNQILDIDGSDSLADLGIGVESVIDEIDTRIIFNPNNARGMSIYGGSDYFSVAIDFDENLGLLDKIIFNFHREGDDVIVCKGIAMPIPISTASKRFLASRSGNIDGIIIECDSNYAWLARQYRIKSIQVILSQDSEIDRDSIKKMILDNVRNLPFTDELKFDSGRREYMFYEE